MLSNLPLRLYYSICWLAGSGINMSPLLCIMQASICTCTLNHLYTCCFRSLLWATRSKLATRQDAILFIFAFLLLLLQVLIANKVVEKEVHKYDVVIKFIISAISRAVLSHIDAWCTACIIALPHLALLIHDAEFDSYCDAWCTASSHKLMPAAHWPILCHKDSWCTALSHTEPYWCLTHSICWEYLNWTSIYHSTHAITIHDY